MESGTEGGKGWFWVRSVCGKRMVWREWLWVKSVCEKRRVWGGGGVYAGRRMNGGFGGVWEKKNV